MSVRKGKNVAGRPRKAYALRKKGKKWGKIAAKLRYASADVAYQSALRYAWQNNKPWPINRPKENQ